jgi:hypothetical protein
MMPLQLCPNRLCRFRKGRASKGLLIPICKKLVYTRKKVAAVVDNCNLVTGYSIVSDYASMFRLAGENDAESIF